MSMGLTNWLSKESCNSSELDDGFECLASCDDGALSDVPFFFFFFWQ